MEVKKNETIYTILRHVSRSGMTRHISCYVIRDNQPIDISGFVAETLGRTITKNGIKVSGCGTDMGFELIYSLSCKLFCPGKYDHDAAYALAHRWL